jgi:hypothetical protein
MTRRIARHHVHRTRLVTAALGAAVLLAACGSEDPSASSGSTLAESAEGLRPPVVVEAVGGSGQRSGQAGAGEMATDAASTELSAMPYWAGFTYEVGEALPELPTDAVAYQYPAGADVDEATVAALAAALGVEGDPVRLDDPAIGVLWRVGPDDGSAASLTVNRDAQVSWYYSSAWADQPAMERCAAAAEPATGAGSEGSTPGSLVGGDAVAGSSPACAAPEPPVGVPTAAEVETRAGDLLTAIGQDPASFELETYADDWTASVTAWHVLGGIRSTIAWGFGFGGAGVMQWANGVLAEPVATGPYPLIDLDAAIARLEDQQSMWAGATGRGEPVLAADAGGVSGSAGSGETGSAAAEPAIAPTDPVAASTEPAIAEPPPSDQPAESIPAPEPEVATLVDVRADFWWAWDADGSVWLLPAYTFIDTEGRVHTVPAVTDEYLIVQETPVSEPPVMVDPTTTFDPDAPDATNVPVTPDAPTEPVDPLPVDPETLVGLTVADATTLLKGQGLTLRVVRQDGVDLAVTADFSPSRVNVAVEGDTVTEVVSLG